VNVVVDNTIWMLRVAGGASLGTNLTKADARSMLVKEKAPKGRDKKKDGHCDALMLLYPQAHRNACPPSEATVVST
jgi:hypothetical protein